MQIVCKSRGSAARSRPTAGGSWVRICSRTSSGADRLEWRAPDQALVENRAEGVNIYRWPGIATVDLLGCHVTGRAQEHTGLRSADRIVELDQAEVGDPGHELRGQEDVRGLQIAMDNPMHMRMVHGQGQSFNERRGICWRQRPTGQSVGKIAPFHELHRNVRKPVLLADVKDADDTRMREPRRRLGLGLKPRQFVWDRRRGRADLLERNQSTKCRCRALKTTPMPPRPMGSISS